MSHPGEKLSAATRARYGARLLMRHVREALGDSPTFLPIVLSLTPEGTSRAVTSRTYAVVEGFPRCGNTFAATALELSAPSGAVISSRVHVPAQVKRAVRLGVPTVVVIRDPGDAVTSLTLAAPHVPLGHGLREYAHHYEELLPYRNDVVVAPFSVVTRSFGTIIDAVNARFGTGFRPFVHTPATEALVFEAMIARNNAAHTGAIRERYDTRPSAERTARKRTLLADLQSPRLASHLDRARRVYEKWLDAAVDE